MNADRLEHYRNQLRGVPIRDLGRKATEILMAATNEAEANEREACARLCDPHAESDDLTERAKGKAWCAAAIRARGNA